MSKETMSRLLGLILGILLGILVIPTSHLLIPYPDYSCSGFGCFLIDLDRPIYDLIRWAVAFSGILILLFIGIFMNNLAKNVLLKRFIAMINWGIGLGFIVVYLLVLFFVYHPFSST